MAKPLDYSDDIYTAMNIADGLIDKMKVDTRISAVQRGYWTALETAIDNTENPDGELIGHILQSFREFFCKMTV